jgi:hypothetical protein
MVFNQQSLINNSFSLVRNHPQNLGEIPITDEAAMAQLPFPFRVFGRQNVAQFRMAPLHLPRPGLLEALGSALVRFQFRHKKPSAISIWQLALS